jgi:hypothetical protein
MAPRRGRSTLSLGDVDASTFTIAFLEHLPRDKWQYILNQLTDTGASIEELDGPIFVITCRTPKQLWNVGWSLHHTHFETKCRIVATSGEAVAEASAYPNPPRTRHGK